MKQFPHNYKFLKLKNIIKEDLNSNEESKGISLINDEPEHIDKENCEGDPNIDEEKVEPETEQKPVCVHKKTIIAIKAPPGLSDDIISSIISKIQNRYSSVL